MPTPAQELIAKLPKAELHVHLEGTLEPELSFALAQRNGVALDYDTPEALVAAYDFHDLPSFLAIYYSAMRVLLTEQDFYELSYAYLKKAREQNVLYCEPFFDPQAHTSRGVSFETVITGIRLAQKQAAAELGIESQLILCFLRDMSAESAMEALEQSLPYKDWIVGVGLDSDEKGNPPSKFAEVFKRARAEGYRLTMHCDVNQENTLGHIRQCLDEIGVDRIDHGINSLEDPAICADIVQRGLGLTVCPVSNRFVVQDLTATHIRRMLELGMRATINSDDPAYFRAYVNENLLALHEEGGLSLDEITQLVRNAFVVAWIDDAQRARYLAMLDHQLAAA
ncbi:adenosine deaminase [Algiphilus sp. W345]|uniref:Adenine deaminase n=1 Tax=Banduia mediterranea TaxID=3075609 RepID=A0ABU2WJU3_9GAMM|nr:adenosine deaminase [Algiphilus sp. W345]MDT0498127.1 adenosine deaminase [Algiphilus sp. W345]